METHDEDWFYDSISRYEDLYMFELEHPVNHVEPAGTSSICVACSNAERHQLLELSLPSKLLSSDNTITSDTDLKIKCGTFTENMCYQIKTVDECKLVVSHLDTKGVTLYTLPSDSDEMKKEKLNIDCPLESPMMAMSDSLMWLTKERSDQMHLYDLKTEKSVQCLKLDQQVVESSERIVPMFLRPDVVAFGGQVTGGFYIADHRVPPGQWCFETSYLTSSKDSNYWSFTTLYECSKELINTSDNLCYAKVSSGGSMLVYDTRNARFPVHDRNLDLKADGASPLQIKFKPGNKDWISLCGFNGNVYVYQLQKEEDPKLWFTHDGHKHVEGYSAKTEVTSHLWSRLNNLVISSADNGTIQMWQFSIKDS